MKFLKNDIFVKINTLSLFILQHFVFIIWWFSLLLVLLGKENLLIFLIGKFEVALEAGEECYEMGRTFSPEIKSAFLEANANCKQFLLNNFQKQGVLNNLPKGENCDIFSGFILADSLATENGGCSQETFLKHAGIHKLTSQQKAFITKNLNFVNDMAYGKTKIYGKTIAETKTLATVYHNLAMKGVLYTHPLGPNKNVDIIPSVAHTNFLAEAFGRNSITLFALEGKLSLTEVNTVIHGHETHAGLAFERSEEGPVLYRLEVSEQKIHDPLTGKYKGNGNFLLHLGHDRVSEIEVYTILKHETGVNDWCRVLPGEDPTGRVDFISPSTGQKVCVKQDTMHPSQIQDLETARNVDTIKNILIKKIKNPDAIFWKDASYTKSEDKQSLNSAQNIVSFRSTQVVYARFVPEFQNPEIFGKFITDNLPKNILTNTEKLSFILAGDEGQPVLYKIVKK